MRVSCITVATIGGNCKEVAKTRNAQQLAPSEPEAKNSSTRYSIYRSEGTTIVKFSPQIEVVVQCEDALKVKCDVLAVKYAQGFHGADHDVAQSLQLPKNSISPLPGDGVLVDGANRVAAKQVLFVGTAPLRQINYRRIYDLILQTMEHLAEKAPKTRHLVMTMHGVNFGLDEREAFHSQLSGIERCLLKQKCPSALETITIVERNKKRAERLQEFLSNYEPMMDVSGSKGSSGTSSNSATAPNPVAVPPNSTAVDLNPATASSDQKAHVFVAMPFSEDMEDVFVFGIQGPVHAAGLLCERVDMAVFTGDILERIRSRIATASLVIADLTGANANVYLEVGYAWGKDRPTLLLMKSGEQLKFDVVGQRCIFYKSIKDLKSKIEADLAEMRIARDGK